MHIKIDSGFSIGIHKVAVRYSGTFRFDESYITFQISVITPVQFHVVASDIKDIGLAIWNIFVTINDGTYVPGQVLEYGLASGAVDVVFEGNEQVLPQAIIDKVDELRQHIINGELEIEIYVP